MGVSGDIVGRAVNAVLVPPQAERFASLVGVDTGRLVLNVSGWNKLVLMDSDRVFLFPRSAIGVEWFERELAAYRALAGARPPRHHDASYHRWLRRALDPATCVGAAAEAADRLGRPDRASAWADLLGSAAQLTPVLVHGDIHEDQLLADGGQLTGVIDWETARVDHPFWDFDLGEWGTGLWRRRRRDFSALWARGWAAYAQERGLDDDSRPLETAFRLRHALRLLADPGDPAIVGTIDEHLAHL